MKWEATEEKKRDGRNMMILQVPLVMVLLKFISWMH
jgi:hypothetical protein